jgi:hypothetical protein
MAREVFDNSDLVCLIYSFGSVDHRIQMDWVADSIRYPRLNRKDKRVGRNLLTLVPNLMKHHRDWRLYVDFFVYKRCMCCSRHSHRKPNITLEEGIIVFNSGNRTMVPEAMDKGDCGCDCRHNCRLILYQLTDIYDDIYD